MKKGGKRSTKKKCRPAAQAASKKKTKLLSWPWKKHPIEENPIIVNKKKEEGNDWEDTEESQSPRSQSLQEFQDGENASDIKLKTGTMPELPASDQFPEDHDSQVIQRHVHHPYGPRRDVGRSAFASFSSCDVTDSGLFRQDEISRETQRSHGKFWNNHGQMGIRRTQSMFNVPVEDNKRADNLRVNRLCQSTTQNDLSDSTEEMSGGEEFKEVLMLKNNNILVTVADDRKRLDNPQVPVYKSIFVTGISDNTTHDAIMLCFESRRNRGGPVENVHFEPSSGCAVVVFQDRGALYGMTSVTTLLTNFKYSKIVLHE